RYRRNIPAPRRRGRGRTIARARRARAARATARRHARRAKRRCRPPPCPLAPRASAERHGVHEAVLRPQIVESAVELQWRAGADVALEHLAVIADLLDDVIGPFVVDMQRLAHPWRDAEHALHFG